MDSHSRANIQEAPTHLHHIEAGISPVLSALDEGGRTFLHAFADTSRGSVRVWCSHALSGPGLGLLQSILSSWSPAQQH